MCGICGIYSFSGQPVDAGLLERMTSVLAHRGPDGSGSFVGRGLGLGHRRLSIIDPEGGAQPILNEAGTISVVFNGEIYNFIELRRELEGLGHRFLTRSDTEVIVHGYEQWGRSCVTRFNGIFAFALWDSAAGELFLARDHLGVKPLYYCQVGDRLLFASEIKALLQDPHCPRSVDASSLSRLFTFRYVPSPSTLFAGIFKLPPGHWMSCGQAGTRLERYWDWRPAIVRGRRETDLLDEYRSLFEDAVRLQMRSDVPVGLFLSSGVDSSALLALMSRNCGGAVKTFTVGFEDGDRTNETAAARQIARAFGADHHEMMVGPRDYLAYYQNYLWDIEEPVGNETAAAFHFVSMLAGRHVKVALTGQGADEPWAGYHRHLGAKLSGAYCRLPVFLTGWLRSAVEMLPRNERIKRGVRSLDAREPLERFTRIYSFFSQEMKEALFGDRLREELAEESLMSGESLRHLQEEVSDLDPLSQILYIDTRSNLPDDLLMVNDKTSMASSIETRVPYLDYRIVQFVETLPPEMKIRWFRGKYLHKKAMEKWLPRSVVHAEKRGFANPVAIWLRDQLATYVNDCLLGESAAVRRYFNADYIKGLIEAHNQRREEYLRQIYLLISFELWHRRFIGSPG